MMDNIQNAMSSIDLARLVALNSSAVMQGAPVPKQIAASGLQGLPLADLATFPPVPLSSQPGQPVLFDRNGLGHQRSIETRRTRFSWSRAVLSVLGLLQPRGRGK